MLSLVEYEKRFITSGPDNFRDDLKHSLRDEMKHRYSYHIMQNN